MIKQRPIAYEPHPVSPERKAELRAQGFQIIDAVFKPPGHIGSMIAERPDAAEPGEQMGEQGIEAVADSPKRRGRPPKDAA